jgi:hypothetical protein
LTRITPCGTLRIMGRKTAAEELGLTPRETLKAEIFSMRLSGSNSRKLDKLAKRLRLGRSAMARLIVEKFIAEHDPDR